MSLNGNMGLGFNLVANAGSFTPVIRDAGHALTRLKGQAHAVGGSMAGAMGGQVGRFGSAGRAAGSSWAGGFSSMLGGGGGMGLLGGLSGLLPGVGVIAGLSAAKDAATEFGFEIAKIRTVVDETAFSTADLKTTTMGLASSYGIDAMQQAAGMYETLSAGITDADKATRLLEAANEFAVGGSTGLAGAVDTLTSVVNTYADQGLSAAAASDQMFTAIAAGKTTAEQLSASLGEVMPTAHLAGVSFGELQAAIAALTLQGIKTPQAITGMNAALSNIMKPSADAAKEAKRLGIEFNATALKSKGLSGLLSQLDGNAKVNANTFTELFGSIDGIKVAAVLAADGGKGFKGILEQMEHSAGATGKAFEIMANTTKFQGDRFAALKKNALILIGDGLDPMQVAVLKVANGILENFAKIPAPVRNTMVVVATALGLFGTAFVALGGPVAFLVAAVIAGGFAIKHAIDTNLGGLGDKFHSAVAKGRLVWDSFVQLFSQGGFSGAVRKELNAAENSGIKNFVIGAWVWLNRLKSFFTGVAAGFTAGLNAAQPAFDAFGFALDRMLLALGITSKNDPIANVAKWEKFGRIGARVGGAVAGALEGVVSAMTHAMDFVSGFTSTFEGMGPTFDSVRASGAELRDALNDILAGLGLGQISGASMSWQKFGAVVGGVVTGQLQTARDAIAGISGIVKGLATVLRGVSEIITGVLTGDWSRVWTGMKHVALGAVKAIVSTVGALVLDLAKSIDKMGAMVGKDFGASKGVRKLIDGMNEELDDIGKDPKKKQSFGQRADKTAGTSFGVFGDVAKYAGVDLGAATAGRQGGGDSPGIVASVKQEAAAYLARQQAAPRIYGPPAPTVVNSSTQLILDGQVLVSHVKRLIGEDAQRSGGDMPAPAE